MAIAYRSILFPTLLATLLIAAGCSDPTSEDPVDLGPGLYSLAMKAEVDPRFSKEFERNQALKRKLCVPAARARSFADSPLRDTLENDGDCSTINKRRVGNAFSGKRACVGLEPPIHVLIDYDGNLAADHFAIDARVAVQFDEEYQGMRKINYRAKIVGTRVGDC